MATRTNDNRTYYINPNHLAFNENSGYGPNLIQVSASSSCYISVYDKDNGIKYNDADKNYQRWKVTAYNNKFPDNDPYRIYVRLERNGASALIVYSKRIYNVDGSSADTGASTDYYYIYIGDVSSTDGTSIRSIAYDTGYLESDQGYEDASDVAEMWQLDKTSYHKWLIEAKHWLKSFTVKGFVSLVGGLIFKKEGGGDEKVVSDIKRSTDDDDSVPVSDESIPTTKYINNIIEDLDGKFLRKDQDDRSEGTIASDKGFEAGKFVTGATGAACYQDKDGNWHIETDHLKVRKKAEFTEVDIQTTYHVGGQQMSTAASMIVDYIFETEDAYRCYFLKKDSSGREVWNQWKPKDQAYCNTFNLAKQEDGTLDNHYLWRLVTATSNETKDDAEERVSGDVTIQTSGYHFVDLSKNICAENSDAPYLSDEIVLLGHQGSDSSRQGCIIVAGAGEGSPYIYEFTGVGTIPFYLPDPETRIKPGDNMFTGVMRIQGGSTGIANMEDFPEEVAKAVQIGSVNLLRNSGFTGDYKSEETEDMSVLGDGSELFSKSLKYWEGSAVVNDDEFAVSGKSVAIGNLSQEVRVMKGENYVVSFKAKGSLVKVALGGETSEVALADTYESYNVKFVSDGTGLFAITGEATICDLQLERGTIATDWHASPYDNDKTLAEFQALKYIQDAIQEGDTTILGGLILSSMIQLGNYKDGVMQKVNAGMSGIYNDNNDVAFWGGGTFEQAISTVMKFKQNPNFRPTDEEWRVLSNFVVSHGGDLFLHGNIYAESGYFRGRLEQGNEATVLERDGSGHLANKNIRWTKEGVIYRRAPENIEYRPITDFSETRVVTYEAGLYFDLSVHFSDAEEYTLSTPDYEEFVVAIMLPYLSRSNASAILSGNFRVFDGESYTSVSYLTIDHSYGIEGKTFLLDYYNGTWHIRSERCVVVEEEWGNATRTVAYLGRQGSINIGEDVESRTTIDEEKVKTQKLEINDESEDAIKVKGGVKVGKSILVEDSAGFSTKIDGNKVKTKSVEAESVEVSGNLKVLGLTDVMNVDAVNVTAHGSFKSGTKAGLTKDIEIEAGNGTHTFKFNGGILTEYKFQEIT